MTALTAPNRLEFVCLYYTGDRLMQRVQARSMAALLKPDEVTAIHLFANDQDGEEATRFFEKELLPLYGILKPKVRHHVFAETVNGRYLATGWRVQQAIKLQAHRFVQSPHYTVLDGKNHFIKPVGFADFFQNGKALTFRSNAQGNLGDYYARTAEYIGIDIAGLATKPMPATTPYTLYGDIVAALIKYVEEREGISFDEYFLAKNRRLTEFYLYYLFMLKTGIDVEQRYVFARRRALSMFTRWPEKQEDVEAILSKLRHPSFHTFGLHRNRLDRLTEPQVKEIVSVWVDQGIFESPAEARSYLAWQPAPAA